ncbi:MAG: alpha/beta hydrolase fold domain-containing protein [Clostridia bacterium]|nr:alpha/beta hydrolase fold domain-containing protein [Clostridia bacterium]
MKIKLWPDPDIREQRIRIGRVPALVLRPEKPVPDRPGVLWIHGGGYITGMKEMVYMGRGLDLVKKYGVTVLSPGYRLAWVKPYPAAVEDCFAVLRYMDENRKQLGISSIMVGGESAGGGLAAAVCMIARDKGIHVAFHMPLYPMISNLDTESSRDNHGRVWNTRKNHFGWRIYLRGQAKQHVSPYAAPAGQTDYHDLPPCYTFVGDGEPFYTETLQYVKNLQAAGVQADVDVYHTDMHAFDMQCPQDPLSQEAIRKFHRHFEQALQMEKSR